MTQIADITGYRKFQKQLHARYTQDLNRLMPALTGENYESRRDTLIEVFPALISPYLAAITQFAAVWAEDLHAEGSGDSTTVTHIPTFELPAEQVEAVIMWAVGPWFGEPGNVYDRLVAAGQRLIANTGRKTVLTTGR